MVWAAFRRAVLGIAAVALILIALGFSMFRILLPELPQLQKDIETLASQAVGKPLVIGEMDAVWGGWGPKLIFHDVSIRSPVDDDELLGIKQLSLGTNIVQLLSSQPLRPAWVDARGLRLVVEQQNNGLLQLRGFGGGEGQKKDFVGPLLDFLSGRGTIALDNTQVVWLPAEGSVLDAEASWFDLAFRSGGGSYHIELSGNPPESIASDLELVIDAKGSMADMLNMNGEAFGRIEELQFHSPWVKPLLDLLPVNIQSGLLESGDFSVRWNKNQTTKITSHVVLDDVRVAVPQWQDGQAPYYHLEQFVGDVSWEALNQMDSTASTSAGKLASLVRRWNLVSEKAQVTMAGETASLSGLDVILDLGKAGDQLVMVEGKLDAIETHGLLSKAEQLPLPPAIRGIVAKLAPVGTMSFERFNLKQQAGKAPELTAKGALSDFEWQTGVAEGKADSKGWPGIQGLSADFVMKGQQVALDIDSANVEINWPWLYQGSRQVDRLSGPVLIAWSTDEVKGSRLDIDADRLLLNDKTASAEVALNVVSKSIGQSERDTNVRLGAYVSGATVPQVKEFIPAFTPEQANQWLQSALLEGDVEATLKIDGPLEGFPYPDKDGIFLVDAHVSHAALRFAEQWPAVTDVKANIAFENMSMRANVKSAKTHGIPLDKLSVTIPDLRDTQVHVVAAAKSQMPMLLSYVRQSPLREPVEELLEGLSAQGDAALDLTMLIPAANVDALSVNGNLLIDKARFHRSELLTLKNVSAAVRFTRDRVVASNAAVDFHGFHGLADLDLDLTGGNNGSGDMLITADSELNLDNNDEQRAFLADFLPSWFLGTLSGNTQLKVDLSGYQGAVPAEKVTITSTLQGLAIDAPLELSKQSEVQRPMTMVIDRTNPAGMRVTAHASGLGGTDLWFADDDAELRRAEFSVGNVTAVLPSSDLLGVAVDVPSGSLDEVLDWFEQKAAVNVVAAENGVITEDARNLLLPDMLDYIKLRSDEFDALGITWHALNATIKRDNTAAVLTMQSVDGSGSVRVPDRVVSSAELADPGEAARAVQRRRVAETIQANFDYLYLPDLVRDKPQQAGVLDRRTKQPAGQPVEPALPAVSAAVIDPREFPVVKASIRDARYMGVRLGQLDVETLPGVSGLIMRKFQSRGGWLDIDATGRWDVYDDQHFSELKLKMTARDWDDVMTGMDLGDVLDANKGSIKVDMQWPGPMTSFEPTAASGGFSVDFSDGVIYKVEPGVAKILGLFSFYSLPRRLLLDFSDLARQGLSFDQIKGDFALNNGNAWTDNLEIRAPGADAQIIGRAGIVAQDYDQRITIKPQLGGGTAVVGALVSGIGVGALLLIGNEVLGKPFDELGIVRMHLTGTWDEPLLNGEPIALPEEKAARAVVGFGRPGEVARQGRNTTFGPRR